MYIVVTIEDDLLAAAKATARRRGYTLGRFIEAALRRELGRPAAPPLPVFQGGTGPRPGVDLRSHRALIDLIHPVAATEPEP